MILDSTTPIGPNSLQMLSQEDQDTHDYQTASLLTSAIVAKADYQCLAPPDAFSALGPFVVAEVAEAQSRNREGLKNQTHELAPIIAQISGAIITDEEISSAPQATPLGSTSQTGGVAASVFTPRQIDAATSDPINWPETLTIQYSRRHYTKRLNEEFLPAVATRSAMGAQPGTPWGSPSGSRPGWCNPAGDGAGISQNAWGKLLLFAGLGLIAVGIAGNQR